MNELERQAIALDGVEDALSKLLLTHEPERSATKATLANVIFLYNKKVETCAEASTRNFSQDWISESLAELCVSHPSRFFVVCLSEDKSASSLEVSVSSRCVQANSGANICSEEIYIDCGADSLKHLPNYLSGLFVPDVPVILVLVGSDGSEEKPKYEVVKRLSDISDRLIYDSSSLLNGGAFSELLSRLIDETELSLCDLSWIRVSRWRELIAEQFESDVPLKQFENLKRIEIDCGGEEQLATSGTLLASWILARTAKDDFEVVDTFKEECLLISASGSNTFSISLKACSQKLPIHRVYFRMEKDEMFSDFSIEIVDANSADIHVRFSNEASGDDDTCEIQVRRVVFEGMSPPALLGRALSQASEYRLYKKIVKRTKSLFSGHPNFASSRPIR